MLKSKGVPNDIAEDHLLCELEAKREKERVQRLVDANCSMVGWNHNCDLRNKNIWSIEGVIWPPGIEWLHLCNNKIEKISQNDANALPDSLIRLNLNDNKLATLNGVRFNHNIELLNLENNKGMQFGNVYLPKNLKRLVLNGTDLNYQDLQNIDWSSAPKLEMLNIQNNNVLYNDKNPMLPIPATMKDLCMDWSTLQSIMDFHADEFKASLPALKIVEILVVKSHYDAANPIAKEYFSDMRDLYVHISKMEAS